MTGTAFGKGPAKGTLKGQMPVSGFLGKGLVNSFLGGDDSTGTLTSPEFTIARRYINLLVGGGKHPNLNIDLIINGKIVRTAAGPNDKPGGTEALDWHTWDVAEFAGKKAVIKIADEQKGGWGHINVDHIVLSDKKKQAELKIVRLDIVRPYLSLPVKNGAPTRRAKFVVDKETVREFDIELATDGKPDFHATADVSAFKGKRLSVEVMLPADEMLVGLVHSDVWANTHDIYMEKHRPLFHFTSRTGWLNDPNGLVYADGEWHLYYQHNPFGREWGNMHWGHAVSKDLFRWKEQPVALYPKKYGDFAFSGSAVSDNENTSGWGTKEKPPLVLAYTSTGRGECIAFSTDKGRTWTEYDKNPVVKHSGRDPKLLWHAGAKHWVMAVYDEAEKKQWIAFYTSPNLKEWTFASRIEGFYECPDLFELPFHRDLTKRKWVLYAADGKYLLGDFDGKTFKPDHKDKKQVWYGNFYAAQSFDNAPLPKGFAGRERVPRRVQIGWAQGVTFPGTSFNQQMTMPVELTLRTRGKDNEPYLSAFPVTEISGLREGKPAFAVTGPPFFTTTEPQTLADGLDAFDVAMNLELLEGATGFTLDLRGTKLVYDAAKKTLACKGVTAPTGESAVGGVFLRVLVDRGSVEIFNDQGTAMSIAALPDPKNAKLQLVPHGGAVKITSANVWRLKSAWEK